MYMKAATLDDLLLRVFKAILSSKVRLEATKGFNTEISGVCLELTQPRARLSRTQSKGTIYSCIGEFLWYASRSSNVAHMTYYLPIYSDFAEPDGRVWGAYGPRLFSGDPSQWETIVKTLSLKRTSRQAVIQLFDGKDILQKRKDVPCTCTLQFLVRNDRLHLIAHMRSNDAYKGLPHDVFTFTMLQDVLANQLRLKLGSYKHMVGSLHVYDDDRDRLEQYLGEGIQTTKAMPAMSPGDPWPQIEQLVEIEACLRSGGADAVDEALNLGDTLSDYWADFVRLLAIFALTRGENVSFERRKRVVLLKQEMSTPYYQTYIRKRERAMDPNEAQPSLLDIPQAKETADAAQ